MQFLEQLDNRSSIVLSLFLALLYYLVLYDGGVASQRQIFEIENNIKDSVATKGKIQQAIYQRDQFEKEALKMNKDLQTFLSYFPMRTDINAVMKKVSLFAESNQVNVVSFKPTDKVAEFPDYSETAFEIEVEAGYHQVMKFLSKVTTLKRAIDFHEMKFKVSQASPNNPVVLLSTTLVIYGYKRGNKEGSL